MDTRTETPGQQVKNSQNNGTTEARPAQADSVTALGRLLGNAADLHRPLKTRPAEQPKPARRPRPV